MLKRIALPAAGAFALAAIAISPEPAAASWIGGAAATQTAQSDLSAVVDVRHRRHSRYHGFWWGAPLALAPFAYYSNPGWQYQYFGPHKRRCGYTWYHGRQVYTCW